MISHFQAKNKRYLTKSRKSIGLLTVIKFSRFFIKIFILQLLFTIKINWYLTKNRYIGWPCWPGFTSIWSFIIIKIDIKIIKLVTAVYDQKQVIFNQKPINRLALLTGALHRQPSTYKSTFKRIDMKKWTGADPVACFFESDKINILNCYSNEFKNI